MTTSEAVQSTGAVSHRRELPGQTALRGLAALVVFIAHADYPNLFPPAAWLDHIYRLFLWHNEAVDLFFVLSGFILCYVYTSRNFTWRNYLVARLGRIYPLYGAALVVMIGLLAYNIHMGRGWDGNSRWGLVANVLLVQNWPLVPYRNSLNFPTWSISVEMLLYLAIFPLLIQLNRRTSGWGKIALIVLPMLVNAAVLYWTWRVDATGSDDIWAPFNPYRGVLSFTSGFFVCSAAMARQFSWAMPRGLEVIVLVTAITVLCFGFPFPRRLGVLLFPVLAYLTAQDKSLITLALRGSLLAWLGDLSYSIYVWHWPILHFLTMAINHFYVASRLSFGTYPWVLTVVSVVSIFLVSHLSHYHFEKPVNRWLRKRFARKADPEPVSMR